MKFRKTRQEERAVYRYERQVEDGRGGYRSVYEEVRPGEGGVTEADVRILHAMDDHWVYSNRKNGRGSGDGWNLSLEQLAEDGFDLDMARGGEGSAGEDVPADVERLREVVAGMLTERQREVYRLVVLEGYSLTDAARAMGISASVARRRFLKALACIRKNF